MELFVFVFIYGVSDYFSVSDINSFAILIHNLKIMGSGLSESMILYVFFLDLV